MIFCRWNGTYAFSFVYLREVSLCGKVMDIEVCKEQLRTNTWGRESTLWLRPECMWSRLQRDWVWKFPTCSYHGLPVVNSDMLAQNQRKKDIMYVCVFYPQASPFFILSDLKRTSWFYVRAAILHSIQHSCSRSLTWLLSYYFPFNN